MASSPPAVIDKPTGKTYWDPSTGIPTEFKPAGGLTAGKKWVPILVDDSGALVVSGEVSSGAPHFDDAQDSITPGVEQILIDVTVPSNLNRHLSQVVVATRVTGVFTITANGLIVGSGRTGPGEDGFMSFAPARPMAPNTEYKVLFQSRLNASIQSVECYVQSIDFPQ